MTCRLPFAVGVRGRSPRENIDMFGKIIIDDTYLRLFMTSVVYIVCILLIYFFFEKTFDLFLVAYFFTISLFITPFYQEYLDPLIYILLFSFFKTKLNIKKYNIYVIGFYYFLFLISAKTYYNIII